jgi:hypothetical protein
MVVKPLRRSQGVGQVCTLAKDTSFVLSRYFADQEFTPHPITRYEYYTQRTEIAIPLGYRLWSADFVALLR